LPTFVRGQARSYDLMPRQFVAGLFIEVS